MSKTKFSVSEIKSGLFLPKLILLCDGHHHPLCYPNKKSNACACVFLHHYSIPTQPPILVFLLNISCFSSPPPPPTPQPPSPLSCAWRLAASCLVSACLICLLLIHNLHHIQNACRPDPSARPNASQWFTLNNVSSIHLHGGAPTCPSDISQHHHPSWR